MKLQNHVELLLLHRHGIAAIKPIRFPRSPITVRPAPTSIVRVDSFRRLHSAMIRLRQELSHADDEPAVLHPLVPRSISIRIVNNY